MNMDTLPGAILVRITVGCGSKVEGSSITLDTSLDAKMQRELRQNMINVCQPLIDRYGIKQPGKQDAIEIITGRTANSIDRLEETLNDCRNLLIDLEDSAPEDKEMRDRITALIDEIGTELGYD